MIHKGHVIHHVRGRMRVKVPGAKGDPALLQLIKEAISPLRGVRQVEVNPSTGSVVVLYDASGHDQFQHQLAMQASQSGLFMLQPPELSEVDQLARRIEQEAEFLSEHSDTARKMVDLVKDINLSIRKATNNAVDLKVLLPLALAAYSIVELESDISTPLWVTLGIFSFNSFLTLHHSQAVHVDRREVTINSPEAASSRSATDPDAV
jgi:hypothetical protein